MNRARLLELYLENGPLGMIHWDLESRVVAWSKRCEQIFGWPESDVLGKTLDELGFVHAPDRERVRELTDAVVGGTTSWNTSNNRNVRADGTVISCRWFNAYVADGDVRGFVSLVEDISEAARALDQEHFARIRLEASEERFRSIFENNPDAMIAFDTNGTVTRANVAAGWTLGMIPGEIVGLTISDLVESTDMPTALAAYNRALGGIAGGVEFAIHRSDGEAIAAFATMIPIQLNGEAQGVDMHVRDLRSQLAQQRHLQTLAYTDAVTALPNRVWVIEQLRARIVDASRSAGSVGVLFLDLDHFKDINDTLGHDSGDRLLRIVGDRLRAAIRSNDAVARMGGDEFVVLAVDSPDTQALATLSDRIIAAIEAPVEIDGGEYFVTTSIGVASFPDDGNNAETLVKHADVAMYRAKERGRNTYQFFTPALNATLQTRLSQEKALRKALESEEFSVYYQPQHDLFTGELVAVEALVRWNHPRLGLVLPGHFIPNAELSGLIVSMGDFVLETACRDISRLRSTIAPDMRLTVNLSARQFHQQRLAAKIAACVERTGIAPTALEMEITESVAMNDAELTVSIMRELGAGGVRLSVDDFGTGYSSLGYLRRFPLDSIKIDRSFVSDLPGEADDATIVRTVIAMAHALDLEVVAEGVETFEQLAFLRDEHCDRVQGFLFSPALPVEELERYIIANTGAVIAGRRATPIPG